MSRGDDILKAIEAAHAAALDERLWGDALARLARLFGAAGATLEDFTKRPFGLRYLKVAGLPSQAETEYLAHYQQDNPRAAYAFRHLSEPILTDYVLTDERTMDRQPFYAKYLKSLDLRYFMSGQIMDNPDAQAIVSIQRSRRQGHPDEADVALMRKLIPHFSQAYDVSRRLRQTGADDAALESVFNWLIDGALLLRSDGTVIHANEAFHAIARSGDGIALRKNAVVFASPAMQSLFNRAFGEAVRMLHANAGGGATDFVVPRPGGAPAYLVSLRPLAAARRHAAAVMLFVRDLAPRPDDAIGATLQLVFGLTNAEAALARALCNGVTPGEYARGNGLSANTVYTHLRHIKDKTGARRLPELIQRINGVQLPLRRS